METFIPPGHPLGVPAEPPVKTIEEDFLPAEPLAAIPPVVQQTVEPLPPTAATETGGNTIPGEYIPPTMHLQGDIKQGPINPPKKTTVIFDAYFVTPIAAGAEEVYPLPKFLNDVVYKAEEQIIINSESDLKIAFDNWVNKYGLPACLIVDTSTQEGEALKSLLIQHADIVIQGVGR
jgi:hypothetical protein